jgi:FkbM family methyltransferase
MIIKFIKKISHSRLFFFKNFFYSILKKNKIIFIDIGAAIQIIPRWKKIHKNNLNYILFEPNKSEAKLLKLNKKYYNDYKIHQFALGEKKAKLDLNITKGPYQSSLLKPNYEFINQFPNSNRFQIKKKIKIFTNTLDSFKIINADFIKIDAQGFNYEVLKGSSKILNDVLAIEAEVEFVDIYKKQKLFGDLNKLLINKNFSFIDFLSLQKWRKNKSEGGQCVFGNALFIKKFENITNINDGKVLKYIAICLLYNKFDIATEAVKKYKFNNFKKETIYKKIKFLEKKTYKSKYVRKIANLIIKIFDIDQNLYLFQ